MQRFHQLVTPAMEFIFHRRAVKGNEYAHCAAMTVAVVMRKAGSVGIGVAKCSFEDQFSKKIGRNIAVGRARKNAMKAQQAYRVESPDKKEVFEAARELAESAFKSVCL